MLQGRVYIIDKPAGMGSTDVVRELRHRLRTPEVGHTGTLDPDATGLLLLCTYAATRLVPFLTAEDKAYRVEARLGRSTVTDDAAGDTVREAPWEHVSQEAFEAALASAVGTHPQRPPSVSAIKVAGRRLHERVRAGEDVDALLAPRIVTMDTARVARFAPPDVTLEVEVGKGFYVRSLVRDLGERLGTAAHVTSLRRTRIGPFSDSEAIALDDVTEESGLPWLAALERVLPELSVSETVAKRLSFGQRIGGQDLARIPERGEPQLARFEGEPVAVVSWDGERLTIVRGLSG